MESGGIKYLPIIYLFSKYLMKICGVLGTEDTKEVKLCSNINGCLGL